jgi:hypothetical protein
MAKRVQYWTSVDNTNLFSSRVYGSRLIYTNRSTVTIVFTGYNTPQA